MTVKPYFASVTNLSEFGSSSRLSFTIVGSCEKSNYTTMMERHDRRAYRKGRTRKESLLRKTKRRRARSSGR
jgi:hypothetical protein